MKEFGKHRRLLIVVASGHGKVIADVARAMGQYDEIAFVDDNKELWDNEKVVGNISYVIEHKEECDAIVAIGNADIRRSIQTKYEEAGVNLVTLIHPTAYVAQDVEIGAGTVVMAGAVIQPETQVGKGVIVNTGATIDHECRISDYTHISVGANLAGNVSVREGSWVGIGAKIIQGKTICGNVMIGAGAVVIDDIDDEGTYVGVPARMIKA